VSRRSARLGGSRIGKVDACRPATEDSVATALVAALLRDDIDVVFGVGGTHTLHLLGAFERARQLRFVASRTELGAAYMAIGYARISGKPAVLLTSTGPGALNVTAALQDACWSSVPVIHLTTHISEAGFAGGVHETPQQNVILGLASKNLVEVDGNFVADAVTEAVRRAKASPSGPVTLTVKVGIWADTPRQEGSAPYGRPEELAEPNLDEVLQAIDGAERPLLYVGGGALMHDSGRAALALAETLQAPILTSNSGKTVASRMHPLYLGPWASEPLVDELCAEADVALVLGSKLSSASTNYWKLALPEVTYRIGYADEPHREYPQLRELRGDAGKAASALTSLARPRREGWATNRIPDIRDAVREGARRRAPTDLAFVEAMSGPNAPALVACETAKAGFWVMKFLDVVDHASHVMSGYLAMGSALPMAVGMAAASGMPVTAVLGDGGLQMSLAELATLAELALPVTLVVIVDHAYGLLRDNSAAIGGSQALGIDLWNPDFGWLCNAYDLPCIDVHTPADLAGAFSPGSDDRPRMILVHGSFSRKW
jgi:acetolactate synthase I/II/III large subunit